MMNNRYKTSKKNVFRRYDHSSVSCISLLVVHGVKGKVTRVRRRKEREQNKRMVDYVLKKIEIFNI